MFEHARKRGLLQENIYVSFLRGWTTLVSLGLLCEFFRSHARTHTHTVELLWGVIGPSQRPLPDNTQHSQGTEIHTAGGFRTRNPSQRAAVDPSHRREATGIDIGRY